MKRFIVSLVVVVAFVFSLSSPIVFAQTPCEGNFDCDQDVDGTDAAVFKSDFGRSPFSNPCPTCQDSPCPCNSSFTCEGILSPLGRWCDQENGTVKDMTTGLVWLKKADWGGQYPLWADLFDPDAHHRAAQLWDGSPYEGSAGLSDGSVEGDWRLPTKTEFVGITIGTEYILYSQMYFFTGVQYYDYWSGTSYVSMPEIAWYVSMINGLVYNQSKFSPLYVWPVRGGQ